MESSSGKVNQTEDPSLKANQLARELQKSQTLFEISQLLAGTIELRATLQQIADSASMLIPASNRTILHLLDRSGSFLEPVAISGNVEKRKYAPLHLKSGQGVAGMVLATGESINVADVFSDERYIQVNAKEHKPSTPKDMRALLVVPVKTVTDMLGTLSVSSPEPGAFTPDDQHLLTSLGAYAALAIDKARLYDDLNRALEHEKAARAQLVQSEKLAALGRIVASVAHELNNPLQAIQNGLYLVQMEENLSRQAREDLQVVLNETERMAGLISRLRETYRPVTQESFERASLNLLVEEVHQLLATHLRHKRILFNFQSDHDLPDIVMIRDQIKQVILNICLNAVEAMPGGGCIDVITESILDIQSVRLSVLDTGPGIDPKILPLLFDPFITTKTIDGGTGLGLSITYDIVQRHQGTITAENRKGSGSVFRVLLPVMASIPNDRVDDLFNR